MKLPRFGVLLLVVWGLVMTGMAWWSYAFVDLNLTLSTWGPFLTWQAYRWNDLQFPVLLAQQYVGMVVVWWVAFLAVLAWIRASVTPAKLAVIGGLVSLALGGLMVGHNAQSRDIYNYLFNAKMVVQYGVDPHVQTALDFPSDPWIRFMHNVHTPAPYGYGWTAWSVVPYVLSGAGSFFLVSYMAMRLWMVLGWVGLLCAVWWGLKQDENFAKEERWWRWALVGLHPLILMETLLNGHNDVWMMAPMILAWGLVLQSRQRWHWLAVALAVAASIFLKQATIVLVPFFAMLFVGEWLGAQKKQLLGTTLPRVLAWGKLYGADLAALAMTALLLTPRSKQFLPWYATWYLVWLPFGRLGFLRWSLLGLSFTSQLRYLPWMMNGMQYLPNTELQMVAITWSGAVVGLVAWGVRKLILARK